jgi:predicted negative regulator of RcsB-dependent stress response
MDQSEENNKELKDKILNFYSLNKLKIFFTILIIILVIFTFFFMKFTNEKKNIIIGEKYIKAGLYLASSDMSKAKTIYEEIILSENNFYSILSLNTIIEKNLVSDKNKIIDYFKTLEKSITSKDQKDLIKLKQALFLFKESEIEAGNSLLKELIEENSNLKKIAQDLIVN